jgi:hypothetical protein
VNIPLIPVDKANHFIYGSLVNSVVSITLVQMRVPAYGHMHAEEWGLLAAVLVGLFKEGSDWLQNYKLSQQGLPPSHGVELNDFLATVCGGLVVYLNAVFA